MSGFAADWLALREPLDARSRSAELARRLALISAPETPLDVVDLGAGTGANLRFLAPFLGGHQRWRLVEHDARLLARQAPSLRRWAQLAGARLRDTASGLTIEAEGYRCDVESAALDLGADLDRVELADRCLVTASALLDLVSAAWLERLVRRAAAVDSRCLFALTYDGRMTLDPPAADDALVRERFNTHQLSDKGFGPALGPGAPDVARRLLSDHGYALAEASSEWRIDPSDRPVDAGDWTTADARALSRQLVDGWLQAAGETADPAARAQAQPGAGAPVAGDEPERLARWGRARHGAIERGELALTVGHSDVLAWRDGTD